MGVKLGLTHTKGRTYIEGILRTGCWEYLDL